MLPSSLFLVIPSSPWSGDERARPRRQENKEVLTKPLLYYDDNFTYYMITPSLVPLLQPTRAPAMSVWKQVKETVYSLCDEMNTGLQLFIGGTRDSHAKDTGKTIHLDLIINVLYSLLGRPHTVIFIFLLTFFFLVFVCVSSMSVISALSGIQDNAR